MLELNGLHVQYGKVQVLHDVSMTIGKGEIVALIGANGAGKTTLLRTISGLVTEREGNVVLEGQDLHGVMPDSRVRLGIAQVPEGRQIFTPMTVEDNLVLGAYLRPRQEISSGLERIYSLFPILKEKRALLAGTLSGGQQQMLAVGRALMSRPRLLLLDEPSMGLAPVIVADIFRIIEALRQDGATILCVEQNAHVSLAASDRAYVMESGRIVLEGKSSNLKADPQVRAAYLGL